MGWYIVIAVVVLVVAAIWTGVSNARAVDEQLGVETGEAHRIPGLSYLGGHPDLPSPTRGCWLVVTPREVAIQHGGGLLLRVPLDHVAGIEVETEGEATRRLTATRMLAVGVFALALPKRTPGSVLITVETGRGPLILERERATKTEVLQQMGSALAIVTAAVRSRPTPTMPEPVGSVADELAKLAVLRDAGDLTDEEYVEQKRRLLG